MVPLFVPGGLGPLEMGILFLLFVVGGGGYLLYNRGKKMGRMEEKIEQAED
jgi:hypothetical protein